MQHLKQSGKQSEKQHLKQSEKHLILNEVEVWCVL